MSAASSRWEWLVSAIGLALVLSAIGILARSGLQGRGDPPDIVLSADSVTRTHDGWRVHFTARNRGDMTAAAVTIEGELSRAGLPSELRAAQLDFVPGESKRGGGLLFAGDPRLGTLRLRATGYADP